MPSGNTIQCVDYATNATCPGYPVPGLTFTRKDTYTINKYSSDCFATFSDKGEITYFDPITPSAKCGGSGSPSQGKAYMEATAAAYPNCTATAQWTNVTFVSAPNCTFVSPIVTFLDAVDVPIAGYTAVPISNTLPYTLQLNPADFPRLSKLKIEISLYTVTANVPGATCGVTSRSCEVTMDTSCGSPLHGIEIVLDILTCSPLLGSIGDQHYRRSSLAKVLLSKIRSCHTAHCPEKRSKAKTVFLHGGTLQFICSVVMFSSNSNDSSISQQSRSVFYPFPGGRCTLAMDRQ